MKVVVTGLIAAYPLGGVAWDYLSYVSGFRQLDCEVLYLEDTGQWLYDPRAQTFTDEVSFHAAHLETTLRRARGTTPLRWSLRAPDGSHHGASLAEVTRFCAAADLFLNVSGACWLRDAYRGARRTAYLDSDPGYSQAKLAAMANGTADADTAFSVNLIRAHDCFFTVGENINADDCQIPSSGLHWLPTRQPIIVEDWPFTFARGARSYTTVMSWKTDVTAPNLLGITYHGKDVSFGEYVDLPRRVPAPLQVAVSGAAPRDRLRRFGWEVVDGHARSHSPDAYRDYLRGSRGEWSVAKNAYVALQSGWFSSRSAAYLALGKPVVVQDTAWSRYYPTGNGLFPFRTVDEAAAAIDAVESAYLHHCDAARALAEQEFAADKVLTNLLDQAGCS